jgi:hypothetical protein
MSTHIKRQSVNSNRGLPACPFLLTASPRTQSAKSCRRSATTPTCRRPPPPRPRWICASASTSQTSVWHRSCQTPNPHFRVSTLRPATRPRHPRQPPDPLFRASTLRSRNRPRHPAQLPNSHFRVSTLLRPGRCDIRSNSQIRTFAYQPSRARAGRATQRRPPIPHFCVSTLWLPGRPRHPVQLPNSHFRVSTLGLRNL